MKMNWTMTRRRLIAPATGLAVLLFATVSAYPDARVHGSPERGHAIVSRSCAACHGADGNSTNPLFPKLSGQNPDYLYGQLRAFKAGGRQSRIMAPIATDMSDTDMADVASYFARQSIRADQVRDKAGVAAGRHIFYDGANHGATPACAMCHGASAGGMSMMGGMMHGMPMMRGMMAAIPKLNGQHAAYLVRQLQEFASGRRQSMMMNSVAASLTHEEMQNVSDYLADTP